MSDTNFIVSATDKTKAVFASVEKGLGGIAGKVFSLQGMLTGLAGAAGFGALVKMSGDSADALAKTSDRLGVTTQKLAGLQYAAGMASDVTGEVMVQSLEKMNRKIAEAAMKGGEGADAIERLGLNARELAGMSADQQFEAISAAMQGVGNAGERAYIAQKLMGEQGVKLLNTMMLGKDGLAAYTREAESFGVAIDRVQASKIEEANDQIARAGMAVKGIGTTVAVELAPYMSALAKQFADAFREHKGFKTEILSGAESITNAVAFMGDMWRGLSVVWQGLKVVFWGFIGGMLTGWELMDQAITGLINKIPGLEAKPSASLAEWAEDARKRVFDAQTSLADLAMQPMPGEGIKQFFAEVRAEAEASAQKVAAANTAMATGQPMVGASGDDGKERDQLATQLAKLEESLMSENERMQQHYVDQQFIAEEAFQSNLVTSQERQLLLEQLEAQHQQKLNATAYNGMAAHEKFATAFRKGDVRNALAFGAEMTQGVAQQNRTMFEVNKTLALANAAVALPDAVMQSFRNGGGYPWGLIPAGLMLATGLSQISAISSTQFGSGGSAPSLSGVGGGSSTVNTVPLASSATTMPEPLLGGGSSPRREFNLTVKGSSISVETLRDEIAPMLEDAAADGAFNLNIRTTS